MNYLLPISSNLEQVGDENSVAGIKPIEKPTPVPPENSGLLTDGLTESQPETLPSLLPKQHEPVNLEPPEWLPQAWQVMNLRLVRTNMLYLGKVHIQ